MAAEGFRLLHHDSQILVVHKPAGWTIYAEDGVPKGQYLQPQCEEMFGQKFFPVHRLDRATCGIVVFAGDGRWAKELQQQFNGRSVKKKYLALVEGRLQKEQKIELELKEKGRGTLSATTIVKPLKSSELASVPVTLIQAQPQTGRFHQVRKHCRLVGLPIVGDKLYGRIETSQILVRNGKEARLMLSATGLEFAHPRTKKQLKFIDTPDASFSEILEMIGLK